MYLVGPRVQGDRVSGGTTYRVGPCLQRDRVSEGPRIWWDRVYRGAVYLRDRVYGGAGHSLHGHSHLPAPSTRNPRVEWSGLLGCMVVPFSVYLFLFFVGFFEERAADLRGVVWVRQVNVSLGSREAGTKRRGAARGC